MSALAADKNTVRFGALAGDAPSQMGVKATTLVYAGAGVVNDAGVACPARTATGLVTLGVARIRYDNSAGPANAIRAEFDHGDFLFVNDGTDLVVQADVGLDCFWKDDQTVSHTASGKSRAGKVIAVDPPGFTGVVVRVATGQ